MIICAQCGYAIDSSGHVCPVRDPYASTAAAGTGPALRTDAAAFLMAIAALAKPTPRIPRIIVGAPVVGDNEITERASDGLILMGRTAFEKLKAYAVPFDRARDPFAILSGIEVEEYGDRADHAELVLGIVDAQLALPPLASDIDWMRERADDLERAGNPELAARHRRIAQAAGLAVFHEPRCSECGMIQDVPGGAHALTCSHIRPRSAPDGAMR